MKQIETEEQYQKAIEWLPEQARKLEHPLIPKEEWKYQNKLYDAVSGEVQRFNSNRSEIAITFY